MTIEAQVLMHMMGEAALERFNATVSAAKAQEKIKELEARLALAEKKNDKPNNPGENSSQ